MTKAAQHFGKDLSNWLRSPEVREYVDILNSVKPTEYLVANRGRYGGTWAHPKLAVRFAQWLDVDFAPATTMSSKEIAELLEARHDNVKRAIERMADRGVFTLPPLEETSFTDSIGKTQHTQVYQLDKRSSLIVVAQLSPEFTARVVDRWQELEAQAAVPALPNFSNPAEAARAWAPRIAH